MTTAAGRTARTRRSPAAAAPGRRRHRAARPPAALLRSAMPRTAMLRRAGVRRLAIALAPLTIGVAGSWFGTIAAFTDSAASSATFSTATVAAPTGLGCPSLGLLSSYIYWTAVPGATRYDVYVGATYQGSTTSTSYGAGFLLSNTTYTVVTNVNGWQSPFTSRITITVVLILVSCSATA